MKAIVLFCCAVAVGAAAASVYAPQHMGAATVVAVAMLVCALVVAMMAVQPPKEMEDARLAGLARRIDKTAADVDQLRTRSRDQAQKLAELEHTLKQLKSSPAAKLTAAPPQLRQLQQPPVIRERPALAWPEAPTRQEGPPVPGLFLEPVVRLSEGRTAYYKASLQRTGLASDGEGQPVVSADLAWQPGGPSRWDATRDHNLLEQALPVVAKLRARRVTTGLFIPVGMETLEDRGHLEAYVSVLRANPEAAAGIVLDLHVSTLSGLSEAALRGLAWLASLGATWCLTGPGAAAMDASALSELGFGFVDVPFSELVDATGQPHKNAGLLVQSLKAHNLTLIAAGLTDPVRQAGLVPQVSLGRGSVFSAPRALKAQTQSDQHARHVA